MAFTVKDVEGHTADKRTWMSYFTVKNKKQKKNRIAEYTNAIG